MIGLACLTVCEGMGEILLTLLVICSFLLVSWGWKAFQWLWLNPMENEKHLKKLGFKGPPYKFLHGNTRDISNSIREANSKPMELSHRILPRIMPFLLQTVQKYGKMSYVWFGPVPRLIVTDPDMIKDILSDRHGIIGKERSNPYVGFLLKGLVEHEGDKWAMHRRILNPAFHQEKLKMMQPAFYACCSELVNKWQMLVAEDSCELDVWHDLQDFTADVISRTAFGSSYKEGRRIFQLLTDQTRLVIPALQSIYIPGSRFLPTKRNRRIKTNREEIRTLLKDLIIQREKGIKMGEARQDDLLGLLIESNIKAIKDGGNVKTVGMSIDEVIEECNLFYFAGQETTGTLLVLTLIVLCMHKDWQEKAREEVLQVFGSETIHFDGLNRLKIVTMILNEVLRLYPSAAFLTRTTKETSKIGKFTMPPGISFVIPLALLHREPEFWGEDAEEFKPERFSEGISKATKNKLSYAPFSWGPRICIGMNFAMLEAKMVLAMLLQKFSFDLSPSYAHAPYSLATLRPQHGAPLIIRKVWFPQLPA